MKKTKYKKVIQLLFFFSFKNPIFPPTLSTRREVSAQIVVCNLDLLKSRNLVTPKPPPKPLYFLPLQNFIVGTMFKDFKVKFPLLSHLAFNHYTSNYEVLKAETMFQVFKPFTILLFGHLPPKSLYFQL